MVGHFFCQFQSNFLRNTQIIQIFLRNIFKNDGAFAYLNAIMWRFFVFGAFWLQSGAFENHNLLVTLKQQLHEHSIFIKYIYNYIKVHNFFFWPEKSIFREIDILEKTILCEVMTTASAFVLIRHPPKIRLNGHLIIVLFKNIKFEKNGR